MGSIVRKVGDTPSERQEAVRRRDPDFNSVAALHPIGNDGRRHLGGSTVIDATGLARYPQVRRRGGPPGVGPFREGHHDAIGTPEVQNVRIRAVGVVVVVVDVLKVRMVPLIAILVILVIKPSGLFGEQKELEERI